MRIGVLVLWAAGLVAVGLVLPTAIGFAGHPEHAIRTVPLLTHAGRILRDAAPGQRFLCEGPGLERIDVALTSLHPESVELELVLREGDATGEVVRRASALPPPTRGQPFVPFRFEPVLDSAGRWYHFELSPAGGAALAGHTPWVRYRGRVGRNEGWGDQVIETDAAEGTFGSPLDGLRALAFACEDFSTERGWVRFELFELGRENETPLRSVQLPPTVVKGGYAFFGFRPIPDSAGRTFAYRVLSSGNVRFVGKAGQPTFKTYHGAPGGRPGLEGMTSGGEPLTDRDLVFRAWSEYGPARGWETADARAGWRLWAALLCWAAAAVALVVAFAAPLVGGARREPS